jgi:hypothetical protein
MVGGDRFGGREYSVRPYRSSAPDNVSHIPRILHPIEKDTQSQLAETGLSIIGNSLTNRNHSVRAIGRCDPSE